MHFFAAQKAAYNIDIISFPLLCYRSVIYFLRRVPRQANRYLRQITDMYSHQCQTWFFKFSWLGYLANLNFASCTRGCSPSANLNLKLNLKVHILPRSPRHAEAISRSLASSPTRRKCGSNALHGNLY